MIAELFIAFSLMIQNAGAAASAPALNSVIIEAQAPAEPVVFGKPFSLVIRREWNANDPTPAWRDSSLAPLVVTPKGVDTETKDNKKIETRRFDARAFKRDEINIPELNLHIKVASALEETAGEVEPPPGPFAAPFIFPWKIVISSIVGALASALCVYFVQRYLKKRAASPRSIPAAPPIPAPDRALARLAALRQMLMIDDGTIQKFYVEASSIVREYLEEQLGVRAPEMTTEEFLNSRSTEQLLNTAHRALLSEYLLHCDLVKFARRASTGGDREKLILAAERFIQETRGETPATAAVAVASEVRDQHSNSTAAAR